MIPRPSCDNLVGESNRRQSSYFAVDTDENLPPKNESAIKHCLKVARVGVIGALETFFFHYGKTVSKYPVIFIILCVAITLASSAGFTYFTKENTGTKLWIKKDSSSRINTDWLWENYPPSFRFNSMIFEADNVLTPEILQTMYKVRKEISEAKTKYGDTWSDMCQKIPVVRPPNIGDILFGKKRRKRRQVSKLNESKSEDFFDSDFFGEDSEFFEVFEEEEDPDVNDEDIPEDKLAFANYFSAEFYPDPYCKIVREMEMACFEHSILELWGNDGVYDSETDKQIEALTHDSILEKINNHNRSGIFLNERNFTELLSEIERHPETGLIIGARATIMRWFGKMNGTAAKVNPAPDRNEPIDPRMLEFEGLMLDVMLNTSDYPDGLKSYPNTMRSFGDIASSTILGDAAKLGIGYTIVFIYIMIMLGKFNCVEQRAFLAVSGIVGVVMGIVVSYGLCSLMGLFFGPMHQSLPFLMLGIGIDDMFVIVQCFETLTDEEKKLGLHQRFGLTMAHAGVAITITSVTDIIAFGIGGTTVLPALMSFCLYASVGIVAIYFFQCTFFVAWMSLDQRRIESHRNACCCCVTHKNWRPNAISQKSVIKTVFKGLGKALTKWPIKVLVLVYTVAVTGVGIWGNLLLEQRFDITLFLPSETYLAKWFVKNREYFPFGGDRVTLYFYDMDYRTQLPEIQALVHSIENQTDIVDEVDAWTTHFIDYTNEYLSSKNQKLPETELNETDFKKFLTQFMYSPRGGKYREQFKFEDPMECGEISPKLLLSTLSYRHRLFSGPSEHVPAMNRMKDIIYSANINASRIFPLSKGYTFWETDEIIAEELYRNLGLAVVCVFITTLILISNFLASFLVLLCVIFSLIDVGGFMHFWDMTIDTVSCTMLVIAIGLCVDYSAHIAHRFMVETGTRDERVRHTLTNIGPAVLNGGFTTFLAFALLATSRSHVFMSFFKVFFLVVIFGLFHGLIVLPVILSLIGPEPTEEAVLVYMEPDTADNNGDGAKNRQSVKETNIDKEGGNVKE